MTHEPNTAGPPLQVANPRRRRARWKRILFWIASCLAAWAILGALGIWVLYELVKDKIPEIPELNQYNPSATTRVFSQDGQVVAEFAVERRDVVPANRIPRQLVEAFISSEDDNFFNHRGIDPMGILRAALKNLRAGRAVQGGSTITQQVAKSFVGREKTFTRKFKEAVLALRLEKKFSKEDILYLYLNQIYLGHGSYGVQAAASNYFHKNVWDLALPEMATIAGLPQAPSDYDPVMQPAAALERRGYVLGRMGEVGAVSREEEQAAQGSELKAFPITDIFRLRAPYFVEEVRRQIQQKQGTDAVYEAGLTVETALNLDWEHASQVAVNRGLRALDHRQGYRGPFLNLEEKKRGEFLLAEQKNIEKEGLTDLPPERAFPAVVEAVSENQAKVAVGNTRGIIPITTMRWARPEDPTVHYQSAAAQVRDVRKVLKVGDLILVRRVDRKALAAEDPALLKKILPEGETATLFALDQIPAVQGALVSVEPRLGYVRAMIGGYNFQESEFNRVLQACRQPGSAFKPIHYSLAIAEKDFSPATIIIDSPVVYDDPEAQNRWKPENYEGEFQGKVTVHKALVESMNLPSIKVLDIVGINETIAWAHKLGITTPVKQELGIALGSSCVKPWDLLNVYSVFNMGGIKPELTFVRKIVDRFGRVLINRTSYRDPWQSWDEKFDRAFDRLARPLPRIVDPQSNYIITHLMMGVASRGTAASARAVGKPVAGKTGTTNDSADAWFMGFSHDVVTAVWVGKDNMAEPLSRGENGSRAALPIWIEYMKKVLDKRPQDEFDIPPGISFARIDPLSGQLARPDTPQSVVEAFKQGKEPKEYVPAKDTVRPGQFFKVDKLY